MALESLQERLGYTFRRGDLLTQALTHRSYAAQNNERLEFLGDGVLNCIVGLMLYERFPALKEGQLSRMRANLVNQQPLYEIACELGLGGSLRLGEGEMRSGGAERPSILADGLESVIGAVLLDSGFDAAQALVGRLFARRIEAIDPEAQGKDAKTQLQEWLQSRRRGLPAYNLLEVTGQAHAQSFNVECRVDVMDMRSTGQGASRKAAEQAAAMALLRQLRAA
jgi:ribonuclease-3